MPAKRLRNPSLGAEDDGGTQDHRARHGFQDAGLAGRLGAGIGGSRCRIGADGGDMHHARNAGGAGRLGNGTCPEILHRVEGLGASLIEHADKVDDGIGAFHGAVDRPAMTQVRLHRHDLADGAERLHVLGEIGTADGDAHPVAAPRQRPHHMAAEKAGSAEDGDELAVQGLRTRCRGHGCRSLPVARRPALADAPCRHVDVARAQRA